MTHHHTLTIPPPAHWTPEQVLAVWERLEILTEHIGHRYAIALQEALAAERKPSIDTRQTSLFDDEQDPF
ncbi:hypothetical protein ECTPHS_13517 [Ectothiorhodospira sp. PHS-1]|uniref:hypothetical protein n=1 Tax=Ectothiorhodospira sp. PHS-1 TaxID=519989 RepID=UPI00024A8A0C|nr:hypothetical protein [Ectothiorhodospira sp. PHS-1]EHQ53683.1 hypothetical protein ECTPHS_13517 [Ectothiorhodospira sp. PHS-1]